MEVFKIHRGSTEQNLGTSASSTVSHSSSEKHGHCSGQHSHSSGSGHRRQQVQGKTVESIRKHQLSSFDDNEEDPTKKNQPIKMYKGPDRRLLFDSTNRLPSKTQSLVELSLLQRQKNAVTSKFASDTKMLDPPVVRRCIKLKCHRHTTRPSNISINNNSKISPSPPPLPSEPTTSSIQTSQQIPLSSPNDQLVIYVDQVAPLNLSINGIERSRLKTAATSASNCPRKKVSVGSTAAVSLPNLNDSGIVYDENANNHHGCLRQTDQDCPNNLHSIVSEKVSLGERNDDDDPREMYVLAHNSNDFYSSILDHPELQPSNGDPNDLQSPQRHQGAADEQSATSTSSGESTRGSGGSNRCEETEDEENSRLTPPQTPVDLFCPAPTTTLPVVFLPSNTVNH